MSITRPRRLRTHLRDIAAHEAARALGREVAVGPVEADIPSRLTVRGLALADKGRLRDGTFISTQRLQVTCSVLGMALAGGDPVALLRTVEVDGLGLHVVRGPDGKLNLPTSESEGADKPSQAASLPGFSVAIRDSALRYTDHKLLSAAGTPLDVFFTGDFVSGNVGELIRAVQGQAKSARPFTLQGKLQATSAPQKLRADVKANWSSATLSNLLATGGEDDEIDLSEITLHYRPDVVLRDKRPAAQALEKLRVRGETVRLSRDEAGRFTILRHVNTWFPKTEKKTEPPRFPVSADIAQVAFSDHSLAPQGGPLELKLQDLRARLNLGKLFDALAGDRVASAGTVTAAAQVSLGGLEAACEIDTNVTTGVTLTALSSTMRGRTLATAHRILASYDLGAMSSGEGASAIDLVEVEGAYANVTLDERNQPTFLRELGLARGSGAKSAGPSFAATIRLLDAAADITVRSVNSRGRPLKLSVTQASAELDAGALAHSDWRSAGHASAAFQGSLGRLNGRGTVSAELGSDIRFADLWVRDGRAETLWADSGRIGLNWGRLKRQPASAVNLIQVRNLRANVIRSRDGKFAVLRSLPQRRSSSRSASRSGTSFAPRVKIGRGSITYVDHSRVAGVNAVRARDLRADIRLGRLMAALRKQPVSDIGSFRASISAGGPGVAVAAHVRGEPSRQVTVENLRVVEAGVGETVSLARVRADYDLQQVLAGDVMGGVHRVALQDGRADVVRREDGAFTLVTLLAGPREPSKPKATQAAPLSLRDVKPVVVARNLRLQLTDHSAPEGPLKVAVEDLNGTANLSTPGASNLRGTLRASSPALRLETQLSTDVFSDLTLAKLRMEELSEGEAEAIADVGSAQLRYDLPALLQGGGLSAISRVGLQDFDADLTREQDGQMRVVRLLKGVLPFSDDEEPATDEAEPAPEFHGVIAATGGNLRFRDESLPGGPVQIVATDLRGRIDAARLYAIKRGKATYGAGWARARLAMTSPRLTAAVQLDAQLDRRVSVAELEAYEVRDGARVPVALIPRAKVKYKLAGLFRDRPLEALQFVGLETPPTEPGAPKDWGALLAGVTVTQGRVRYVDHQLGDERRPFTAEVVDLHGAVEPGQIDTLMSHKTPATIEEFALTPETGPSPRVQGKRVTARFDLAKLLDGNAPPQEAFAAVEAEGLDADVTRDEEGRLDIATLFEPFSLEKAQAEAPAETGDFADGLNARLKLSDSTLHLTDLGINSRGPVELSLAAELADVDLGRALRAQETPDLRSLGTFAGSLSARLPGGTASSKVASVDVSRLLRLTDVIVTPRDGNYPALDVSGASVEYDLAALLDGKAPIPAAFSRIELDQPRVALVRREGGDLDVESILAGFESGEQDEPARPTPAESFTALVRIDGGQVDFLDFDVPGGPIRSQIAGLGAELTAGRFWSARAGNHQGDIGWLRGAVRARSQDEQISGDIDWSVSRRLGLRSVGLIQRGRSQPTVALDLATVEYDPAQALAEDGDLVAALRDINVGKLLAYAKRLEDGSIELPQIVAAYMPEPETPAAEPSTGRPAKFLGGLVARFAATDLNVTYDDLSDPDAPLRVRIAHGESDIDFARVAQLHAGNRIRPAGHAGGTLTVSRGEARLQAKVVADIDGRLELTDAYLAAEDGKRRLVDTGLTSVAFDPVALLADKDPLAALSGVTSRHTVADIVLDANGEWELAHLLPASSSEPDPSAEGMRPEDFTGTVTLEDTTLTYLDRRTGPDAPFLSRASAKDFSGTVDMAALWQVRETGEPRAVGNVKGQVSATLRDARVQARLESDLAKDAHLWDVSVVTGAGDSSRRLVALSEARLSAALAPIIAGKPPMEHLRALEVWDLQGDVRRDEAGTLELQRVLGFVDTAPSDAREADAAELPRLAGVVTLHNANIAYDDRSLDARVAARELDANVDLGAVQQSIDGESPKAAGWVEGLLSGAYADYEFTGKLSGDVHHWAGVSDLSLRLTSVESPPIKAREFLVRYDLPGILQSRSVAGKLEEVVAEGLRAQIVREADGSWQIMQGLPSEPASDTQADQPDFFTGTVRLADADIEFIDHSVRGALPLRVHARGAGGAIDTGALLAMRDCGISQPAGQFRADLDLQMEGLAGTARIDTELSRELTATSVRLKVASATGDDLFMTPRTTVRYDLGPILQRAPLLDHVSDIVAMDLTARLTREADGELRLAKVVRDGLWEPSEPAPAETPAEPGEFRGRVGLQNARLQYVDHALLDNGPLLLTLTDAGVDADFAGGDVLKGLVNAGVHIRTRTEEAEATIGGQLEKHVVLTDLRVSEIPGSGVMTADRVALSGDFGALMRRGVQPVTLLKKLEVVGLRGTVKRNAQGQITSPQFLAFKAGEESSDPTSPIAGAFRTWVSMKAVDLRLEDEGLLGENGPLLSVHLAGLGGELLAEGELGGEKPWVEPQGSLHGTVTASTEDITLTTDLETDLVQQVWIRNLSSMDSDEEKLAQIDEAYARYDLNALTQRKPAYEILTGLKLRGAAIQVGTDSQGRVTVAGLPLRSIQVRSEGPESNAGLVEVSANIDTDDQGVMRGRLQTTGSSGLLAGTQAEFVLDPADGWLDATYTASRVDLPLLGRILLASDQGEAIGGYATVSGLAYGRIREKDGVVWNVSGELVDGRARLARLGDDTVQLSAPFELTSEGLRCPGASIAWSGMKGTVSGSVFDLSDPVLALDVDLTAHRGDDLLKLLPESARERLEGVALGDRATLHAQMTGPLQNAAAEVSLETSAECVATVAGVGDIRLDGLNLAASLVGWKDPSVRATASVDGVAVSKPKGLDAGLAETLHTAQVGPAAFDIVSAGQSLGGAHVAIPWGQVHGLPITDMVLSARLTDAGVDFTGLKGNVLGGRISGAGGLVFGQNNTAELSGRVRLAGADLAGLAELDQWPEGLELAGEAQVTLGADARGAKVNYAADLYIDRPVINGKPFDEGRVLIAGNEAAARIPLAQLQAGEGSVWIKGQVTPGPKQGASSAKPQADIWLAAAEMDVARLPVGSNGDKLGGHIYATAHVTGPLDDPDLDARLQVFGPSYESHEADALLASVGREGSQASIRHVMFGAGQAVVALNDVRLDDFRLYMTDENRRRFAPDGDVRSGRLQMFAPASDIARVADTGLNTGGWLQMSGAVGGSLRRPTLTCMLSADRVQLGEFFVDEVNLPLSLVGNRLTVAEGYVRSHGAELSVVGRVDDLYGDRSYGLVASLPGLALEDLPPVHRLELDVSGMASMPELTIWGSRTRAPEGGAIIRLSNVRVRDQVLEPVTGLLSFGDGLVEVNATRIRPVASQKGRVARASRATDIGLAASYAIEDRMLDARVRVGSEAAFNADRDEDPGLVEALPDIGGILQLAARIVSISESASRNNGEQKVAAGGAPKATLTRADRTDQSASPGSATAPPASETLARLGLRTTGKVAGSLRLMGPPDDLSCRARLSVWDAEVDGKTLPRLIRGQFSAGLQARHIYGIEAEALDGQQMCRVSGDIALPSPQNEGEMQQDHSNAVDLTIEGADIELSMWRHWMNVAMPVGGAATFLFEAKGQSDAPTIRGSLDILKPSFAGAQFDVLNLPLIEITDEAVNVRRARLVRTDEVRIPGEKRGDPERIETVPREVVMQGSLPWTWGAPWVPPDGEMDFSAELADIDLGFFPRLLDEIERDKAPPDLRHKPTFWSNLEARGAVSASVKMSGAVNAPVLAGELKLVDGSVRAGGWKQPVEDLQADVRLVRENGRNLGRVTTARARWGAADVRVDDAWAYLDHLGYADLAKNEYHMDMSVASERAMQIAGIAVNRISGGVAFHTRAPVEGEPRTAAGALVHDLKLQDLTLTMRDGAITASGGAQITDFTLPSLLKNACDITIASNSAYIRRGKQLRGILDGTVHIHGPSKPEAPGADAEETLLVDGNMTLRQAEIALAVPRSKGGAALRGAPRALPSPVFDVRFLAGEAVRLRGLGITVPIEPMEVAHLTGTFHRPLLTGGASALARRTDERASGLQVVGADVQYRFGPVPAAVRQDRPELALTGTIQADARQFITDAQVPGWGSGDVEVFISIRGDIPDQLQVDTWSSPALNEQQILALVGAQQLGGLQVSGRDFGDALSEQALNLLAAGFRATIFQPIETELMRLLGLSEFNVSFGFNQNVEFRLGKYIVDDLLLSYERSVGGADEDSYDLSLSYRLKNRLRVAYTTNQRGENRVKLSYDVDM